MFNKIFYFGLFDNRPTDKSYDIKEMISIISPTLLCLIIGLLGLVIKLIFRKAESRLILMFRNFFAFKTYLIANFIFSFTIFYNTTTFFHRLIIYPENFDAKAKTVGILLSVVNFVYLLWVFYLQIRVCNPHPN